VELPTDPTVLFRFSALTYNTHRIHYDEPYVTAVEGYHGLVVHGPLLALLLLEIPRRHRPGCGVARCDYRLARPVFAGATVRADHAVSLAPDHTAGRAATGETDGTDTDGGTSLRVAAGVPGAPPSISATITLDTEEHRQ
jgi:3-methylfumaryl-CoA hydratase